MPYIKVTFDSAKLCSGSHYDSHKFKNETRDKVWSGIGSPMERPDDQIVNFFQENGSPIKFEPVSNMLHVLMGIRPVSTNRQSISGSKRNEHIDEIVSNGWFKIDNMYGVEYKTKSGEDKWRFIGEFTQGKKNQSNSHRNDVYTHNHIENKDVPGWCSWMAVRKKLCFGYSKKKNFTENKRKVYYDFVSLLEECLGRPIFVNETPTISLSEVLGIIAKGNEDNKKKVDEFLSKNNLTSMKALMGDPKSDLSSLLREDGGDQAGLINNISMVTKVSLNGSFIFDVDEEDYQYFKMGPQYATYLDEGVAHIEYLGDDQVDWEYEYDYKRIVSK